MDNSQENPEVNLTQDEVWNVIEFARSMSGFYQTGYLNPELVSGRLKDISLNPLAATEAILETAFKNPKENEKELQQVSQFFELVSMVYKRLISYSANMLSFDVTYTSNAEPDDYGTPKYKKDLVIFEKFLDEFNYKKEFRIAVREMLRNDAFFACFRDTGSGYVLQELPSEYCKITGRWKNGFLFSFNMYWFLLPGVDINMYPDFFKRKYIEIWGKNPKTTQYIPSLSPTDRGSNNWVYWVDIPVDIGVCFKFTPELATRLPYFSPLFNDLVLQPLMRNLQKSIIMAEASRMIMGEVPMLNKEAKATVKDMIAITPDTMGKFLALVKSAIGDAVKVASAPLQNIRGIAFEGDNEVYDQYLRTALATSGVNSNLVFSSNIKPNAIETQLSLNVDEQLMTPLYEPFAEFMEYFANKKTRTFKFSIQFEGTEFFVNRDARLDKALKLLNVGIPLPQKIAAAMGMKPSVFRKQMEEALANDFMGKLTPPALAQQRTMLDEGLIPDPNAIQPTAGGKDSTGQPVSKGRPRKSTSELGDEGVGTRGRASNVGRGGKV